jgi:hypothetical protein
MFLSFSWTFSFRRDIDMASFHPANLKPDPDWAVVPGNQKTLIAMLLFEPPP